MISKATASGEDSIANNEAVIGRIVEGTNTSTTASADSLLLLGKRKRTLNNFRELADTGRWPASERYSYIGIGFDES
jgi:hypothetical protein